MIARALLAAALLLACSSEPKCQYPAKVCSDFKSSRDCKGFTCSWSDAHCRGASSVDCHVVPDEQACRAVVGCAWASVTGQCTGFADCAAQVGPPTCGSLLVCSWLPERCQSSRGPELCDQIDDRIVCGELGCDWK